MKLLQYLSLVVMLFNPSFIFGQTSSQHNASGSYPVRNLVLEPGIGLKPYPATDVILSNVFLWNVGRKFSLVSYTSYSYNSAFLRNFNYIRTDYNYSLSQQMGIGTTFYATHASHSFSLVAGIKYDAFKESLENPAFEKVMMSISSVSPDAALIYHLRIGQKKVYFSYRMCLPLYPYPFKTVDMNAVDGNLANVTMEFGVGIRLK